MSSPRLAMFSLSKRTLSISAVAPIVFDLPAKECGCKFADPARHLLVAMVRGNTPFCLFQDNIESECMGRQVFSSAIFMQIPIKYKLIVMISSF